MLGAAPRRTSHPSGGAGLKWRRYQTSNSAAAAEYAVSSPSHSSGRGESIGVRGNVKLAQPDHDALGGHTEEIALQSDHVLGRRLSGLHQHLVQTMPPCGAYQS